MVQAEDDAVPAPDTDPEQTRPVEYGNSPPTVKCAAWPEMAVTVGSASVRVTP